VDVTPWLAFKVFLRVRPFAFIWGSLLSTSLVTAWGMRAFEQVEIIDDYWAALYFSISLGYTARTKLGQVFSTFGWFANVCLISLLTAALIDQIMLEPAEALIVEAVVGNSIRKEMLHAQISLIQWTWRRHFVQRLRAEPNLRIKWIEIENAMLQRQTGFFFVATRVLCALPIFAPCARKSRQLSRPRRKSHVRLPSRIRRIDTDKAAREESEKNLARQGIGFCLLPLSLKESQSQRLYAFYLGEFRSLRRQLKARQQSTMEESTQEV